MVVVRLDFLILSLVDGRTRKRRKLVFHLFESVKTETSES